MRMGSVFRSNIQNSNLSGKATGLPSPVKVRSRELNKDVNGEYLLKEFIEAYFDLVDKKTLSRFRLGDKQAINEALIQIHKGSLKKRASHSEHPNDIKGGKVKCETYAEVVERHNMENTPKRMSGLWSLLRKNKGSLI